MAFKIQFITSNAETTPTIRKAHQKLARSHVTARRHFAQRQRDVEEHERRRAQSNISIGSTKSPVENISCTTIAAIQPNVHLQACPVPAQYATRSETSEEGDLRLEAQGGNLIEIPFQFPVLRTVTGVADPFKSLPGGMTPRMRPHLYYCN